MRHRIVIIIVFTALSAAGYLFPRIALNATAESAQQDNRRTQTNQQRNRRKPGIDYSKFQHRTDEHKDLACDACHEAPTPNWPKASGFPDIADYPAHASCVRCHRTEFFKGARPVICSICHTQVSPRAAGRFAFGKLNQPSQFATIFPHDKHQDVIALNRRDKDFASAHAVRRAQPAQEKEKYNNCAICHETDTRKLTLPGGFSDNFQPPAGTFKTTPVSHLSCFNCHWKNQEPTRNDCKGCHQLMPTDVAQLLAPERLSLKFTHTTEQHVSECTTCHINITRESSALDLKPDVPIPSCSSSSCHGKEIEAELDQRDSNAVFACARCHTSDVGKRAAPASHRAALGQ